MLAGQLKGQRYVKLNERGTVYLIPAENPAWGMLCGTNVYAILMGGKFMLVDAPECQKVEYTHFLRNLETFMKDKNAKLEGVLITHSHYDHFGGAGDVVELCKKNAWQLPKIYKKVDGNRYEAKRLKNKMIAEHLHDLREGQSFTLGEGSDSVQILPIETPGHLSDHLCFELVENVNGQLHRSMFTGDHIIGGDSTYFEDYPAYFESLLKTKKLVENDDVEALYPAHSVSLHVEDIRLPALKKVSDYIARRVKKDRKLEQIADSLQVFTLEQFFDAQTAKKQAKSPNEKYQFISARPEMRNYMLGILAKQLQKLVVDGKYALESDRYVRINQSKL